MPGSRIVNLCLWPIAPTIREAKQYSVKKLYGDLIGGATVAVVAVPQAMAFAQIAEVPLVYGIYTVIVQCLLGALMSSSNHLSIGPTNTMCLLIAASVTKVPGVPHDPEAYAALAIILTFMAGLIQLAFAFARIGDLVRYVSHSVIVGFTAGAGILIAAGQVPNFLGIPPEARGQATLPGILGRFEQVLPNLDQISWQSVSIGVGAMAVIILAKWIHKMIPGPFMAVVIGAGVVAVLGWSHDMLPLVGELPQGLPSLQVPEWSLEQVRALVPGAIAIALVGLVEGVSIGKSIGAQTGQRIEANREFFAQGVTNFASSFAQCIPGTGSFSRSALNHAAGSHTRFAGMFNSVFVAAIFLLFAPQARFIPLTTLAAVLFIVAYKLIDFHYIVRVAKVSRTDLIVCLATLIATLLIDLEYAIFLGVFLNIALYVRKASRLKMAEMVKTRSGPFVERPLLDRGGNERVRFLQLEGDLFFGVADELQDRLTDIQHSGATVVIFRLKRTHSIDATVLEILERFATQMTRQGRHIILCGLKPSLLDELKTFGVVDVIGPQNVFATGIGVFTSAKAALDRARDILGHSIDIEGIDVSEDTETWAYEI